MPTSLYWLLQQVKLGNMSRFGASKFRNAIPAIPPREEWYRSTLPSGGTSTNLQTSTFSSEVKANHLYIVTVTPSGGVTWRGYGKAASEDAKSGTVGAGTVGDWDLSQVGGGSVVVGGADGSVSARPDDRISAAGGGSSHGAGLGSGGVRADPRSHPLP